jgi:hypothetical protein
VRQACAAAAISKPVLEVPHNHVITGGLNGNTETRTLAQDVFTAKTATANYMKELHLEITQNLQLHYLIIVDVANRGADIFRYMTELGVI